MRDETAEWLNPMMDELQKRNSNGVEIDLQELMMRATMPAAEVDSPIMNWVVQAVPDGATTRAIDWVRLGQLLRHELGWDDTYPAMPDFPEARDIP